MKSLLCKAAVFSAALALVFFCSCERHKPDELPAEEHAKSDAAAHERAEHAGKKEHVKKHGDDQSRATTAMPGVGEHASPAATPAQFFPEATPH